MKTVTAKSAPMTGGTLLLQTTGRLTKDMEAAPRGPGSMLAVESETWDKPEGQKCAVP